MAHFLFHITSCFSLLSQIGSYVVDTERSLGIDETDAQLAGGNRREHKDALVANGGGLLSAIDVVPGLAVSRILSPTHSATLFFSIFLKLSLPFRQ